MPEIELSLPGFFKIKWEEDELAKFWASLTKRGKNKAQAIETLFTIHSDEDANSILNVLYQKFLERDVDPTGRNTYVPLIKNLGYWGITMVTRELVNSEEMNEKVTRNLEELYQKHLKRKPDGDGIATYSPFIKFFGKEGREFVEETIKSSPEYHDKHGKI